MRTIAWNRVFRLSGSIAAVYVFMTAARLGGLLGLFLGLTAIFVIAVFWTGPIANLVAGWVAKATTETWWQREKTDLCEIEQLMRDKQYALATQRLEAIIIKEPYHIQARVLAVTLHRLQGQNEKARQVCLELINRDDVALRTIQALMAQIGMNEQEIQQISAGREREGKKQTLLLTLRQNPENHWARARLIQLLITEFGDYAQAQKMLNALTKEPDAPQLFLQHIRAALAEKCAPASSSQSVASQPPPGDQAPPPPRPSQDPEIDNLLAGNFIGSAVERLDAGLEKWPDDFEGWMLLARVQTQRCHSATSAERVVAHIRLSPQFTPEQKSEAAKRLREWNLKILADNP